LVSNYARAEDPPNFTVAASIPFALPPGITTKDYNSDKAIERTFKDAAEDALSKTGFDNLVDLTVEQDRDRIKKSLSSGMSLNNVTGDKNQGLHQTIDDIQSSWKAKYGHKFDLDYKTVYTADYIKIITGEVNDPDLLVGHWPLDVNKWPTGDSGKMSSSDLQQNQKNFGGEVKLEKGRNVAITQIMGRKTSEFFNTSLIHEAGGWKFDIPNTINADQLYQNLSNNLAYVDQNKDRWPADEKLAYREVTRAVVASLYNVTYNGANNTAENMDTGTPRPLGNANNR
jgi:hypothetical protein